AAALQSARKARAAAEESLIDPLTGVGNRRRFDAELAAALSRRAVTALCMLDLDHFKAVNDTHGHPAGDALLEAVSSVMRDAVRPSDSVYRIGGEEFAIVLRDTPLREAVEIAERVRSSIEARPFDIDGRAPLPASASFGVAASEQGDPAELIAPGDAALYEATKAGRNRVHASRTRTGAV